MSEGLKRSVVAGESVVGSWVSIGHPAMSEIPAALGFDFVVIDTEHTPTSLETVGNMVRAVDAASGPTEPIVRVADNDPILIKRVLDIGVAGVMVPMVETAQEARAAVEACRYPPAGNRGIAAARDSRYGMDLGTNVESAGEELVIAVQVETETALTNVESIASVEGVDVVFVGPADLSASLGVFADWDHERYRDAVERVVAAADESSAAAGILALDADDVRQQIDTGFSFVIAGIDATHVIDGCRDAKRAFESGVESQNDDS